MPTRALIKSFAKINLYLDVIGKRSDGYHDIETIFQTVSLHDEIELQLTAGSVELTCNDPAVPTDHTNLALKAFLSLKNALSYPGGIRIILRKNIPPGSGLGGGSSNAAAILVAVGKLLGSRLPEGQLREIARALGADVPFFISGGLAAAWQIGDRLVTLPPLVRNHLVIAMPRGVSVSTASAYALLNAPMRETPSPKTLPQCTERFNERVIALAASAETPLSENAGAFFYNALEEPVFSLHPEIGSLKELLLRAGARGAVMSGSGSAVFGIADSSEHAVHIKQQIETSADCRCFVAHTVEHGSEII
ncbi:MAG: 4-(cytidine 5'-diphospho)-2-C-methyl-D-erythritol kinase [Candidatus Abyssubacteria bacterium]